MADFLEGFILSDSQQLRLEQSDFETVITGLIHFLNSEKATEKFPKDLLIKIRSQLAITSIAFNTVIASDRMRKRVIFGSSDFEAKEGSSYSETQYIKIMKHHRDINQRVATSENPLEFIGNLALKTSHSHTIGFNAYSNVHDLFSFLSQVGESPENGVNDVELINIMYSDGKAYLQATSKSKGFRQALAKLDPYSITQALTNTLELRSLTPTDIVEICKVFAPLQDALKNILKVSNSTQNFILIPSVNLFPIPFELILGTACNGRDAAILVSADYGSALEFLNLKNKSKLPQSLVASANPIVNNGGFETNLDFETSFRSNSSIKRGFSLTDMPPLLDAVTEAETIGSYFQDSKLYLNEKASIESALKVAEERAENQRVLILLATHGVSADYDEDIQIPGLLTIENEQLDLFTIADLKKFSLKNTVVLLSACDTASGFTEKTHLYFSGFVSGFSDAGSELILASLWPVKSLTSKATTEIFMSEQLKNNKDIFSAALMAKKRAGAIQDVLPFVFIYP